jgi:hypothetical protein
MLGGLGRGVLYCAVLYMKSAVQWWKLINIYSYFISIPSFHEQHLALIVAVSPCVLGDARVPEEGMPHLMHAISRLEKLDSIFCFFVGLYTRSKHLFCKFIEVALSRRFVTRTVPCVVGSLKASCVSALVVAACAARMLIVGTPMMKNRSSTSHCVVGHEQKTIKLRLLSMQTSFTNPHNYCSLTLGLHIDMAAEILLLCAGANTSIRVNL